MCTFENKAQEKHCRETFPQRQLVSSTVQTFISQQFCCNINCFALTKMKKKKKNKSLRSPASTNHMSQETQKCGSALAELRGKKKKYPATHTSISITTACICTSFRPRCRMKQKLHRSKPISSRSQSLLLSTSLKTSVAVQDTFRRNRIISKRNQNYSCQHKAVIMPALPIEVSTTGADVAIFLNSSRL